MSYSGIECIGEADIQKENIKRLKLLTDEYKEKNGRALKACIVTFGCQMNFRDSEKLCGILKSAGFEITEDENCDLVIYNTCTVRDNADQRVFGRLGVLKGYKKNNPSLKIALCGCMMQEPSVIEKIKKSYSHVDLIFGTHNLYKFPEYVLSLFEQDDMIVDIWEEGDKIVESLPCERKYPYKSGVNIMFGCNNFCTYCIVPYVRGRERSRAYKDILNEIRSLSMDGVCEVMLLGQNVNSYGKGLDDAISFPALLEKVCQIEGIKRVRFMTSHPKDLSDDLIKVMSANDKICSHLHLPLQSGSDRILKAMNRNYTKDDYLRLADKIKNSMPDISLTTDIIVGFPTETDADVDDTISVVDKVKFDNAFTFEYSIRTGTSAAKMEQVDNETVKRNFDRLLKKVQFAAKERALRFKGREEDVLIEEINDHEEGMLTGRLSHNMLVHFKGDPSLIGTIRKVRMNECKGFYYLGELIDG